LTGAFTEALTVLFIAGALAMDAFAVSIAASSTCERLRVRHALRMAGMFGLFQAVMPLAGYFAGMSVRGVISDYDHWVAFVLLGGIGANMIFESLRIRETERRVDAANFSVVAVLAVATSIDALAVGFTISIVTDYVFMAAVVIGLVTFFMSCGGAYLGHRVGHIFEDRIEIVAAVLLILIGVKILVEHLVKGI
jgi:putative Mn2+ efflux pump MntP